MERILLSGKPLSIVMLDVLMFAEYGHECRSETRSGEKRATCRACRDQGDRSSAL